MTRLSFYNIEQCNALARALPKLRRRVNSSNGPAADSPAWDEAYHVQEIVGREWRLLRWQIAEACTPWFDDSAFKS